MYDTAQREEIYEITERIEDKLQDIAREIAADLAKLIKNSIPKYLINEYIYVNQVAGLPLVDAIVEVLISRGYLEVPENGIGAEGCWMYVKK